MNYEQAKQMELKLIDRVRSDMAKKGWNNVDIDDYSRGDLILEKDGEYKCFEVKTRTYDLRFFEKEGTSVEQSKLEELSNIYGVEDLILLTVTSDGWLLKSKITFNSKESYYWASKTTCFGNKKKTIKMVYLDKDFKKRRLEKVI